MKILIVGLIVATCSILFAIGCAENELINPIEPEPKVALEGITFRVVEPLFSHKNGPGIENAEVTHLYGSVAVVKETATDGSVSFSGDFPLAVRIEKPGHITTKATVTEAGQEIALPNEWPKEAKVIIDQLGLKKLIDSGGLKLRWGAEDFPAQIDGWEGAYTCNTIVIRKFPVRGFMLRVLARTAMQAWQGHNSPNPPCDTIGWTQTEIGQAWVVALEKDLETVGPAPNLNGLDEQLEHFYSLWYLWYLDKEGMEKEVGNPYTFGPNRCRYLETIFGAFPPKQ